MSKPSSTVNLRQNLSRPICKNEAYRKLKTESSYKSALPEPRVHLNLEQLVQVNSILESIFGLCKEQSFEAIFNKATQWWDETAKLQECLFAFYRVSYYIIVGRRKFKDEC